MTPAQLAAIRTAADAYTGGLFVVSHAAVVALVAAYDDATARAEDAADDERRARERADEAEHQAEVDRRDCVAAQERAQRCEDDRAVLLRVAGMALDLLGAYSLGHKGRALDTALNLLPTDTLVEARAAARR